MHRGYQSENGDKRSETMLKMSITISNYSILWVILVHQISSTGPSVLYAFCDETRIETNVSLKTVIADETPNTAVIIKQSMDLNALAFF